MVTESTKITLLTRPALTPARKLVPTPEGWKAELTQATQQCTGRELNSRSLDHKSDALTTTTTFTQRLHFPGGGVVQWLLVSMLALFNEVNQHGPGLLLGQILLCRQINSARHAQCCLSCALLPAANLAGCNLIRVPTLLLTKNPGLSRTPMRNFPGPFQSKRMLKYKEKTLPSPPDLSSLPLEVGPFTSSQGIWGSAVSSPKNRIWSNFSLKI